MSDLYEYPVVVEIPVAWGDMDAFKHVNNTYYFKYFETARTRYLESVNILEFMNNYAMGPILGGTSAKFLAPVTYPDTLSVGIRTIKAAGGRMVNEYAIWSQEQSRLVTKGESTMVFYDYKQKQKCDLPEELMKRILTLDPGLQTQPEDEKA